MKKNPTIGYCRNQNLNSMVSNCYRLTHSCATVSSEFAVVPEFKYEDSGPRYIWSNIKRLLRAGHIKTLILSELRDVEYDLNKFINFIEFMHSRNIRLISLKENFDSLEKGAYFKAVSVFIDLEKAKRIYRIKSINTSINGVAISNKFHFLRGVNHG